MNLQDRNKQDFLNACYLQRGGICKHVERGGACYAVKPILHGPRQARYLDNRELQRAEAEPLNVRLNPKALPSTMSRMAVKTISASKNPDHV